MHLLQEKCRSVDSDQVHTLTRGDEETRDVYLREESIAETETTATETFSFFLYYFPLLDSAAAKLPVRSWWYEIWTSLLIAATHNFLNNSTTTTPTTTTTGPNQLHCREKYGCSFDGGFYLILRVDVGLSKINNRSNLTPKALPTKPYRLMHFLLLSI